MTDLTERSTRSRISLTVLAALVFVVGMELARFQFGSLGWYQRDTIGIGALDLLPLALAPFIASVLVPLSSRLLSLSTSLRAAIVVLVAARLVTQFAEDPALDHWASAVGVAAFVGLLALLAGTTRMVLVGGILLGITLDSALKAVGSSLDLVYREGWAPGLAAVVVAAAIVYLGFTTDVERRAGPGWLTGLTLVGLGPYLFVQYLVLQSAGWTAEVTGTGAGLASLRIVVLNVVALWLAHRFGRSPLVGAVCALVVGAAVVVAEGSSLTFNLLALVAVPAAGPLWALMVPDFERPSVAPAATWITTGMVLFLLLGFAYYLPLDLDLGFSQAQARITGGVLVGLVGLVSALRRAPAGEAVPSGMPVLAAVALILPLASLLPGSDLPDAPDDLPIRVMAYNLHQAFGTSGEMDVDAVADVILESGATIVGMQEVARGGLLNAGTDLFLLLGERLGWEHSVFFGTTDPVWGNAILGRGGSSRATGVCSGHGPEQARRRAGDEIRKAKPAPKSPDHRAQQPRRDSNPHYRPSRQPGVPGGVSLRARASKSPDQEQSPTNRVGRGLNAVEGHPRRRNRHQFAVSPQAGLAHGPPLVAPPGEMVDRSFLEQGATAGVEDAAVRTDQVVHATEPTCPPRAIAWR
jgi:hypothetical protein